MLAVVSLIVSAVAVTVAVVNAAWTRRNDQRDLFLQVHVRLLEPELVAGRRALYKIRSREDADALSDRPEEMTQIYRALAMFDLMALYVESQWIAADKVLDEWGNSLARSLEHAEHFIASRRREIGWDSWPHYRALASRAQAWEG